MIKKTNIVGSLVILSCYVIIVFSFQSILAAIIPFFIGVAISAYGLVDQKHHVLATVYIIAVFAMFSSIFAGAIFFVFALPVIAASVPMIMAFEQKEQIADRKSAPI